MASKCHAEVQLSVPNHKKSVKLLKEKTPALDKLHSVQSLLAMSLR